MLVLGLDVSLRATGWSLADASGARRGTIEPGKRRGGERLVFIAETVNGLVARNAPTVAVIEDYAFHAEGRALTGLAEARGVICLALTLGGVPYTVVNQSALKLYGTGKGQWRGKGVGKRKMIEAARLCLSYGGSDDNEADAMWLAAMGVDHYLGVSRVPDVHRRALDGVKWPRIREGAA